MKTWTLTIIVISVCSLSFSQDKDGFGIKAGINYGSNGDLVDAVSNAAENPDANIGFHAGIFGKLSLTSSIYLRPELVYTNFNSEYEAGDYSMDKLDLPVLVGINIFDKIAVFAGPSFQYILENDLDVNGISLDDIENDFSIGVNFGVGVNLGNLGIDLRYERGFNENEANVIDNNTNGVVGRLDTRPEQLILSLSVKI